MTKITWGNPYTHEEHSRESSPANGDTCDWCGQRKRTLYKYDNSRGWFCNKECHKAYYGS